MNQCVLIFEKGVLAGQRIVLTEQTINIGRSDNAEITIPDKGISQLHAKLSRVNEGYQIEDLGSSNGTFINDDKVESPRILKNGDQLKFGSSAARVEIITDESEVDLEHTTINAAEEDSEETNVFRPPEDLTPEEQAPKPEQPAAQTPGKIIISITGKEPEEVSLAKEEITFGRLPENDVVLMAPVISRHHFHLSRDGDDYILFPSPNASNPIKINDLEIQGHQLLEHGDVLSIGEIGDEYYISMQYHGPEVKSESPAEKGASTQVLKQISDSTQLRPKKTSSSERGVYHTSVGEKIRDEVEEIPPQLIVNFYGVKPAIYTLTDDRIRIGRHEDNNIVIDNQYVSRFHVELARRGLEYFVIPSENVGNPLVLNGDPVMEETRLSDGDRMRISGFDASDMVNIVYLSPSEAARRAREKTVSISESKVVMIGRDEENDLVLNSPNVSRIHAQLERIGQRYRLQDLDSSNGTFVNGDLIKGEKWLSEGDSIRIGPFEIEVGDEGFTHRDESAEGLKVEVNGLQKWVRKDLNILQNISLAFQPHEFVVVVGQSGGGKSTLVDAIAGYRPATHGRVMINDSIDLYQDFELIRNMIGYVPQKDIIHMELTVFQALDYAAQLRMPSDTTVEERATRIEEVMDELDLRHRKDTQISDLSGGQQKRVSIGVELLTEPSLFFLDEPTSGLDPGMETDLMQLMRQLADKGRTIVLITHATKNVMLADKVVFLARGGYLAWFGPPEEALEYFDQFRTDRQRRTKSIEFDDIYNLLDQPENGTALEWADRYKQYPAYKTHISNHLDDNEPVPLPGEDGDNKRKLSQRVSAFRQFMILSARNMKILTRDRFTLILMILTAPLMASLDFILVFGVGRNPFGFYSGDFNDIIVTLIVVSNTAIMVGGLSFIRELVKEREIYKRERLVNLKLSSYILSKLWFAIVLALYHSFFFTLIRHLAFDMPGGFEEVLFFYITVLLLVIAGMMMGLFTSAIAPNSNAAPLILVLFLLPQMMMSGALVPLPSAATAPISSHWAFQAVIGISGAGSDVAGDACWAELSKEEQDALSLDEKESQCTCMGVNALREEVCAFPGSGDFYIASINQDPPVEPQEPGSGPESPEFPDAPVQPENMNDPVNVQNYLAELEDYNEEVAQIQDDFEAELDAYQQEQDAYKEAIESYQEEFTEYETERASAVGSVEATIDRFYDSYPWTFINKADRSEYLSAIYRSWGWQLLIITVLFTATVIIQKRHDVI